MIHGSMASYKILKKDIGLTGHVPAFINTFFNTVHFKINLEKIISDCYDQGYGH